MKVRVLFFGFYRDLLGCAEVDVELQDDAATVGRLWERLVQRHGGLAGRLSMTRFAVNLEHVGLDAALPAGAEVAVFPPLAGGAPGDGAAGLPRRVVGITDRPINEAALRAAVEHPAAGAVVEFRGVVRNHDAGRDVLRLEYEAYSEMATRELESIAGELEAAYPVRALVLVHRIGSLVVGDTAVVVLASADHRAAAFAACREGIERIKQRVPIFKREHYADGTEAWVGVGEGERTERTAGGAIAGRNTPRRDLEGALPDGHASAD